MIKQPEWTWDGFALLGLIALAAVAWFELWEHRGVSPIALWVALSGQVDHDDSVFGPGLAPDDGQKR